MSKSCARKVSNKHDNCIQSLKLATRKTLERAFVGLFACSTLDICDTCDSLERERKEKKAKRLLGLI